MEDDDRQPERMYSSFSRVQGHIIEDDKTAVSAISRDDSKVIGTQQSFRREDSKVIRRNISRKHTYNEDNIIENNHLLDPVHEDPPYIPHSTSSESIDYDYSYNSQKSPKTNHHLVKPNSASIDYDYSYNSRKSPKTNHYLESLDSEILEEEHRIHNLVSTGVEDEVWQENLPEFEVFMVHAPKELVRVVTYSQAMWRQGRAFADNFIEKYYVEDGDGFSKKSRPLDYDHGEEYDVFWSYRWKTGRFRMWCAITAYYNNVSALLITMGICWTVWIILGFVKDPCHSGIPVYVCPEDFANHTRSRRQQPQGLSQGRFELSVDGEVYGSWWVNDWLGPLVYLFWIIFYAKIFRRRMKLFFDKHSVAQRNHHLAAEGIRALPCALSNAKQLICFFDDEYFNRMWPCYELAAYLRTRKEKADVVFANVFVQMSIFWYVIVSCLQSLLIELLKCLLPTEATLCAFPTSALAIDCTKWNKEVLFCKFFLFSFCFASVGVQFWMGFMYFEAMENLRHQSQHFDVRNAAIYDTNAKEIILDSINEMFVENAPHDRRKSTDTAKTNQSKNTDSTPAKGGNRPKAGQSTREERAEQQRASAAVGVARFNVFVRRAMTYHCQNSFLDRWRFLPYKAVLVTSTFPLQVALSSTGFNFYPFWDHRNRFNEDFTGTLKNLFVLIFWEYFVRGPFVEYFRGAMCRGIWCISKNKRWENKFSWAWWFLLLWACNELFECFFNNFLLQLIQGMLSNRLVFEIDFVLMAFISFGFKINSPPWQKIPGWTVVGVITVFTWFLYEPMFSRDLRARLWMKLRGKDSMDVSNTDSNITDNQQPVGYDVRVIKPDSDRSIPEEHSVQVMNLKDLMVDV